MRKIKSFLLLAVIGMALTSCQNQVRDIPAGFVAKELTPTGFADRIYEPGQVDIGIIANNGQSTSLVLLEASTITVKEQFHQADQTKDAKDIEDHRVMTKTTPLTVDVYVQLALPKDPTLRNAAFAAITPEKYGDRVSVIYLQSIYNKYATQTIRGKVRGIFAKYKDWQEVMDNFEKINGEISEMVINVFKTSEAPLEVLNVQLSNVKEDQRIWDSKNEQAATAAKIQSINAIGAALRNNPDYIKSRKWEVIEKLGTTGNGSNISLIISDDDNKPVLTIPVKK